MTKNMKIRRLERQNNTLRKANQALREKLPSVDYKKKIEENLDKFESINDDLLDLYRKLHKCRIHGRRTYLRYVFGMLKIKIKQAFML